MKTIYNNARVIDERKFTVGNFICISKQKAIFERKITVIWSHEIFKIISVRQTHLRVYYLETYDGEPIKCGFYEHELQKVRQSGFSSPTPVMCRLRCPDCPTTVMFRLRGPDCLAPVMCRLRCPDCLTPVMCRLRCPDCPTTVMCRLRGPDCLTPVMCRLRCPDCPTPVMCRLRGPNSPTPVMCTSNDLRKSNYHQQALSSERRVDLFILRNTRRSLLNSLAFTDIQQTERKPLSADDPLIRCPEILRVHLTSMLNSAVVYTPQNHVLKFVGLIENHPVHWSTVLQDVSGYEWHHDDSNKQRLRPARFLPARGNTGATELEASRLTTTPPVPFGSSFLDSTPGPLAVARSLGWKYSVSDTRHRACSYYETRRRESTQSNWSTTRQNVRVALRRPTCPPNFPVARYLCHVCRCIRRVSTLREYACLHMSCPEIRYVKSEAGRGSPTFVP
ncbi:hypothetical protein PR048_018116 [Dryococelus australis]|uniref:Uncharacterized protein n=1 Tax=Dryococelus australis TaxID=614101 RepID=A0ABQ9HBI4_9NEOP|nr:hypothetical protein PR048_018116 [Dryococelus australis]